VVYPYNFQLYYHIPCSLIGIIVCNIDPILRFRILENYHSFIIYTLYQTVDILLLYIIIILGVHTKKVDASVSGGDLI
jgi:hypothetical protein